MDLRDFPPKVFIIGAQKAGTTYLSNLLAQHPDVELASPKEPHYFTQFQHAGEQWYRSCFSRDCMDGVLVDASPSYAAAPVKHSDRPDGSGGNPYEGVPERIKALSPDAKIVYLVRDPVARMYSSYWHRVRTNNEERDFRTAVYSDSHYRRVSDYAAQLSLYLECFPRERIQVLRFEDLIRDPNGTIGECLDFLGLDRDVDIELETGRNRSFVLPPAVRRVDAVLRPLGGLKRVVRAARRVVPERWVGALGSRVTRSIPPMDPAIRSELIEEYTPMAERFETMTGVRLYPWAGR